VTNRTLHNKKIYEYDLKVKIAVQINTNKHFGGTAYEL